MKSLITTLLICTIATLSFGQAKWELGGQLGGMGYQGDLNPNSYMDFSSLKPGYGLFLKRNVSKVFALKLNYLGGKSSGNDLNWDEERKARGFESNTSVNELSLLLDWDILGKSRYREDGTFRKRFSPYLFAGIGAAFVGDAGLNYNNPDNIIDPNYPKRPNLPGVAKDRVAEKPTTDFTVPFGAGVRIDLTRQWVLGLEYGLRPVFNDYLDGLSEGGDPTQDDWYSFLGLNLSYRFGEKDTDKDGIVDKKDACPLVAGLPQFNGCPDTDGDGIADLSDACPTVAGKIELNGCPDKDNDGIADKDDACPDVAGIAQFNGCPDTDGDGIMDQDDTCPTVKGLTKFKGCPDTDGDGIVDKDDKCPTQVGPASNNGCPELDTDNDGILDKDDKCPTVAGIKENAGCPEMKKEVMEEITLAVKNIQFETNSDKLTAASLPIMEQLSSVLAKYPNYNVNITGHTDSDGKDKFNLDLSDRRAKRCVEFLISKGIDGKRLTAKGFGETKPIATNKTKTGKQINRRVEFELVKTN